MNVQGLSHKYRESYRTMIDGMNQVASISFRCYTILKFEIVNP